MRSQPNYFEVVLFWCCCCYCWFCFGWCWCCFCCCFCSWRLKCCSCNIICWFEAACDWSWVWVGGGWGGCAKSFSCQTQLSWGCVEVELGLWQYSYNISKIFFVWYPKFFPKNLSYETRNYYYQKMRQKSRYKMVLYIIFVAALPQIVHSVSKMVIGNGVLVLRDNYEHTN